MGGVTTLDIGRITSELYNVSNSISLEGMRPTDLVDEFQSRMSNLKRCSLRYIVQNKNGMNLPIVRIDRGGRQKTTTGHPICVLPNDPYAINLDESFIVDVNSPNQVYHGQKAYLEDCIENHQNVEIADDPDN